MPSANTTTTSPTTNLGVNGNGSLLVSPQQPGRMTLTQAISTAKANPTSDFANKLGGFIQNGDADDDAMREGVDLSFAGRPNLEQMYTNHLTMNKKTPPASGSPIQHFVSAYHNLIGEMGTDITQQQSEATNKIENSVEGGAQDFEAGNAANDQRKPSVYAEDTAKGLGETALGTASGAVQGIFAPITGIIQAISDKTADSKALQDFATGNKTVGGILDLQQQLEDKLSEISKTHPEATKNIGDAANVLLATLGGETETAGTDVADAQGAMNDTAKQIIGGPSGPDGGGGGGIIGGVEKVGKATQDAAGAVRDAAGNAKEALTNASGTVIKTAGDQTKGALKSAYSQIYGLPAEDINFLLSHREYANPEALSDASLSNLGSEVEGKIREARENIPTSQNLADEVHAAAIQKSGKILDSIPSAEEIGNQVNDALQTRQQEIKAHAETYPTGPGTNPVNVDPAWLEKQINKIPGVTIDPKTNRVGFEDPNASVETSKSGTKISPLTSPNGPQRLQDLLDSWGKYFKTGKLTRPQFIDFRQDLGKALAKFKGGVDQPLEQVGAKLYAKFNSDYRPQIKGLDLKDAKMSQMINDLDRLKKGLAVEDDFGNLQPQDTALNTILNSTKDTKGEVAKRLEELVPGITGKLKNIEGAKSEVDRLTQGLVDNKGNLTETAANKIANAGKPGKDVLANRLEELVPGITKKITQMQDFNKKWSNLVDENGNQRPGALLNIKNSLNLGRDVNLERLESLMPGISNRLRLIKAAENFHGTLGLKPGKYASGAAVSQVLTGNPLVGIAAMAVTNPNLGLRILRTLASHSGK